MVFAHCSAIHRDVNCVGFDPTGKKLVSCGDDKIVTIWDVTTGEPIGSHPAGHTRAVMQVEFIDADAVVSSSDDGTTRAWDVATGTYKAEFEGDKFSFKFFTKSSGDEQTVGQYLVTREGALVLVQENEKNIAFFHAPGDVTTLECAGDRIAVGCQNGEVLHLQAPWLLETA